MPILSAPPQTDHSERRSDRAQRCRTEPNGANSPDRRKNLKKPESPCTHDLQQYIEDRLRIPLFSVRRKSC